MVCRYLLTDSFIHSPHLISSFCVRHALVPSSHPHSSSFKIIRQRPLTLNFLSFNIPQSYFRFIRILASFQVASFQVAFHNARILRDSTRHRHDKDASMRQHTILYRTGARPRSTFETINLCRTNHTRSGVFARAVGIIVKPSETGNRGGTRKPGVASLVDLSWLQLLKSLSSVDVNYVPNICFSSTNWRKK